MLNLQQAVRKPTVQVLEKISEVMASEYITDRDIEALIDNELDDPKKVEVLEYIKTHPLYQKRYDELSEQKRLLQMWWHSSGRTS